MPSAENRSLFRRLTRAGVKPLHAAEVGVFHPETSNIYDFIVQGVRSTLVEPDPRSVELIEAHFAGRPNVAVYPFAIWDTNGTVELLRRASSTYVSSLPSSPAIVNDGYEPDARDSCTVEARTFDFVDDGTIDLLSVDTEGSEWFVIKNLVSRPLVISLETHGGIYVNPYREDILGWMKLHGYETWYKTRTDSVFVKTPEFVVRLRDRVRLFWTDLYLILRRKRKQLRQKSRRDDRSRSE